MLVHEALEFLPVKGPPLTAAIQPFVQDACGLRNEPFERAVIKRHTRLAKVPAYLGAERAPDRE